MRKGQYTRTCPACGKVVDETGIKSAFNKKKMKNGYYHFGCWAKLRMRAGYTTSSISRHKRE